MINIIQSIPGDISVNFTLDSRSMGPFKRNWEGHQMKRRRTSATPSVSREFIHSLLSADTCRALLVVLHATGAQARTARTARPRPGAARGCFANRADVITLFSNFRIFLLPRPTPSYRPVHSFALAPTIKPLQLPGHLIEDTEPRQRPLKNYFVLFTTLSL